MSSQSFFNILLHLKQTLFLYLCPSILHSIILNIVAGARVELTLFRSCQTSLGERGKNYIKFPLL